MEFGQVMTRLACGAFFPVLFSLGAAGGEPGARQREILTVCDLVPLHTADVDDPVSRRRVWDETHCAVSLQGIVNRDVPRLYLRAVAEPDDFWWDRMVEPGGWQEGATVERAAGVEDLVGRFRRFVRGAVVWDERVPATSNLASTIAGCENLICLRYDESPGSLYRRLTEGHHAIPVAVRLLREDGAPLFTGEGTIPGTEIPSTGSAKCDAYRWLIEHYVRTGKTNPGVLGYYLDGDWLRSWAASEPLNHTITNQDYVIANGGVLFDLNVWDDESPVDDPGQKPGTDADTLRALLRACYDRLGKSPRVIHVAGFVPWAYKYTTHRGRRWAAGGTHEPVPTEWKYAEILSCFNAYMDADALGLGAMANASFFRHYPLRERYPQAPPPTRASLQAAGILTAEGRIVPRRYVGHYVGDYDAAAWLYRMLPIMWADPARGRVPLSWAFNPNLAQRFPLGMAWARLNAGETDFFVAGDSGAGYLNPGLLLPPRAHSGLPSGLPDWEAHCSDFYRRWDLRVTGFVIDGFGPGLPEEGLDAYARFSPGGIVAQKVPRRGVHEDMPYLRMATDLPGDAAEAARVIGGQFRGPAPGFAACRSILKTPSWYAEVSAELDRLYGDSVRVVDLETLLFLVREYERDPEAYVDRTYADVAEVTASPGEMRGLALVRVADGPAGEARQGDTPVWVVPAHRPAFYLYLDVDEAFAVAARRSPVEIALTFVDDGEGRIVLQYDSRDAGATHGGAYKTHPDTVERTGSGAERTVRFRIPDPRFDGMQNGEADFRFYSEGTDLRVRAVRVRRLPAE